MIGVNSDGDRAKVGKLLEKEGIAWRQAVDETTRGPIATKWNVHAWPTIYVLDSKGVIRHRNARGKQLEQAVEALLKEMEGGK